MEQQALHLYWQDANRKMVAKLMSELAYEQAFELKTIPDGFSLSLESGVIYSGCGQANIWGQVVFDPTTLKREEGGHFFDILASTFMLDIQTQLEINDEVLAEHFEDLNATLLGDCKLALLKQGLTANELANMSCEHQQSLFNGHPKFAFNKGRRGWGSDDLQCYAPEAQKAFQLCWVAIERSNVEQAIGKNLDWQDLVLSAMSSDDLKGIKQQIFSYNVDPEQYTLVPVHPWQWHKKLSLLFVRELAQKTIIYLGEYGDEFLPQLSLRTLSNVTRPNGYDIKLPLTIMNTSCYRGIPGRYILAGPLASEWIDHVFQTDPILLDKQAQVLQEPAAAFVAQQDYQQLAKAPYRYHELLGVIWRESAHSKLAHHEKSILMAALMECDNKGNPLVAEYIQASGLSSLAWLSQLFDVVVIPFYHLLVKYGVSLIAHGQNITLVLEKHVPKRILLKDFQGDMRLIDRELPEQSLLPKEVKEVTVKLPDSLIIHDLQTGHFVTVLRFISPLMIRLGVNEATFYSLLGQSIQRYMAENPDLNERFTRLDLFKPRILRIGLNLAKFRHSTDGSVSRMLPDMDDQLDNPLYLVTQ